MAAKTARKLTKAEQSVMLYLTEVEQSELIPWRTAEQCKASPAMMERLVDRGLVTARADVREGRLYMRKVERRMT